MRFSLFSGLAADPSAEIAFTTTLSKQAAALGVRLLDYSAGFYTVDKRLIYPGSERGVLPYLPIVCTVTEGLDVVASVAGNVLDLRHLPELPNTMAVSVGRALIADPDFATKARKGQYQEIRPCSRKGRCHYFSRGVEGLRCGANPHLGQ